MWIVLKHGASQTCVISPCRLIQDAQRRQDFRITFLLHSTDLFSSYIELQAEKELSLAL